MDISQEEGSMPLEREELMVSVTKEQSSFAHFFRTKGGIPRELSVEFTCALITETLAR